MNARIHTIKVSNVRSIRGIEPENPLHGGLPSARFFGFFWLGKNDKFVKKNEITRRLLLLFCIHLEDIPSFHYSSESTQKIRKGPTRRVLGFSSSAVPSICERISKQF